MPPIVHCRYCCQPIVYHQFRNASAWAHPREGRMQQACHNVSGQLRMAQP